MIRQIVVGALMRLADLILPEKPHYPPTLDVLSEHAELLELSLAKLSARVAALETKQRQRERLTVFKGGDA